MALYLIACIGGQRVALLADPVESVVEIDEISPAPLAPPHIAGIAALRSRVLTIVDCMRSLEIGRQGDQRATCTVIVTLEGHQYGLLVDEVLDVVPIDEVPRPVDLALGPGWARAAVGLLEREGEALLLLDPGALVVGPAPRPVDGMIGVNAPLMGRC